MTLSGVGMSRRRTEGPGSVASTRDGRSRKASAGRAPRSAARRECPSSEGRPRGVHDDGLAIVVRDRDVARAVAIGNQVARASPVRPASPTNPSPRSTTWSRVSASCRIGVGAPSIDRTVRVRPPGDTRTCSWAGSTPNVRRCNSPVTGSSVGYAARTRRAPARSMGTLQLIDLERELPVIEREERAAEPDDGGGGRRRDVIPVRRGSPVAETDSVDHPLADPHVLPRHARRHRTALPQVRLAYLHRRAKAPAPHRARPLRSRRAVRLRRGVARPRPRRLCC